jgi:hypothetical protein
MEQISNKFNLSNDFHNLKVKFDNTGKSYHKPSDDQINIFNDVMTKKNKSKTNITDTKLNREDIDSLVNSRIIHRDELKIEDDLKERLPSDPTKFHDVFNEIFDAKKIDDMENENDDNNIFDANNLDDIKIKDVPAANTQIGSYTGDISEINGLENLQESLIGTSTSVSNINEAFEPIRIHKSNRKQYTFEELLSQREAEYEELKQLNRQKNKDDIEKDDKEKNHIEQNHEEQNHEEQNHKKQNHKGNRKNKKSEIETKLDD